MNRLIEWLQIAGLIIAAALLFFGEHFAELFKFDQSKIVAMIAAILAADFLSRMYSSYRNQKQNGTYATYRSLSLDRAITEAKLFCGHVKKVRIYAISSGKIQPLFETIGLRAEQVHILLWRPWASGAFFEQMSAFSHHISALESDWRKMETKGQFSKVEVKRYSELPGDYFILFDDKVLILGTYQVNEVVYSFVDVNDTVVFFGNSEAGRNIISNYSQRFDSANSVDWSGI